MEPDSRDREIQHLKAALRESRTRELKLVEASRKREARHEKKLRQEIKRLVKLLNQVSKGADSLFKSFRWKRGVFLCKNKTYDPILRPIKEFHSWQESESSEMLVVQSEAGAHSQIIGEEERRATVDVVICIHNALDFVKQCIPSVVSHSPRLRKLILVNDGSDEDTSQWLQEFVTSMDVPVELIHNIEGKGYTLAANQGMKRSDADYVVLLNSDTVVPSSWLDALIACGESDGRIGIVGPLSNAASWQSVPERFDGDDWAVNELPEGLSVDRFASRLQLEHQADYPRVSLINGFCLAIKKRVFKTIGYFDEEHFPVGYGEENDFCLRAGDAGFDLAIADDAYVFHAKSKSFTHERRRLLSKDANKVLFALHSEGVVARACEQLKRSGELEKAREDAASVAAKEQVFKMLYLLPFAGSGGGVHSIIQEADGLRKRGVFAQIAIKACDLNFYTERYPNINTKVFFTYVSDAELGKYAASFDVVIATMNTTVDLLEWICQGAAEILPAYYVQDYEPMFYEGDAAGRRIAEASYAKIPRAVLFAKTDWIANEVRSKHGVEVHKIVASIDADIYKLTEKNSAPKKIVCAMVRPETSRRSPELTAKVLEAIRIKYDAEVVAFGCSEDDKFWESQSFQGKIAGILTREEVADLLKSSRLFLDLSTYQAFGRTGLEAMACGCATILPKGGGTAEYARDGKNCLMITYDNQEEIMSSVERLLSDEVFHESVVKSALETAAGYSVDRAAESVEKLFVGKIAGGGQ